MGNENDGGTLKTVMNKFCPIKKEEDTEETYKERLRWLKEDSRREADKMIGLK